MTHQEFLLHGENGYDISCLEWTGEQATSVLVCLHGFAGDKYSSVIRSLAEKLTAASVRVITLDWPGHGSSPVDGTYLTIENCIRDLDTVLEYVSKDRSPIMLFATSFGGFIGVNYLMRNPTAFSKFVLRSPALSMPDTYRTFLTDEDIAALKRGESVNKGFDRPLWLDASFHEDLCAHRIPAKALNFKIPGLVIQGDQDDVVDPEESVRFAQDNGLELHIVSGADHRYKHPGELEEILSATTDFLIGSDL